MGARARLNWHKAAELDELPEGRVKSVSCGRKTICLTHHDGSYGALDNHCPHQGGPLGEGTIENGVLRCPWHGWDYDPITGRSVGPYDDGVETFEVEVREDGVYVGVEAEPAHRTTVTDVMARTMTEWGVNTVFGMVGHSNLGLADALRLEEEAGRLRYFGIRHEGAAAFAASAFGKLTGRPAACLAIAGPGATNLLTGLWDAHVDRAPVLALTGQVDTQVLGPGAFQEVDLAAAFGGVAQWSQTVLHGSRHAELVNLALKTAILNRGVSHLIFPDEVQTLPAKDGAQPGSPEGRLPDRRIRPPTDVLEAAVARIGEAQRPAFIVGHGAKEHMAGIIALAEQLGAPVLTTFKGKGLIPDDHPLGCGVLGRSGTPIASWFMNEADLLVVFGASFSNHTGITSYKPTIQVDFDTGALARFHPITIPVLGEIDATVKLFAEGLEGKSACADHRPEVAERWRLWREEKASRAQDDLGKGLGAAAMFAALSRQVPKDAIIPVDVGNNTYSFGRYFEATGQAVLMSGYLGSIGFALPAAMGAWAATTGGDERFKGRKVVSVSGDGGLGQYLAELTTLVKYGMNITHVVMNNAQLGKISKEQRAGEWPVWQTALVNPSFAAFAENCGAKGLKVTETEALDDAFAEAIAHDGPSLVEVITDADLL
ncbi:MAG: thiamine pyrophosphate-binding protein [Myxococcota bacterium]